MRILIVAAYNTNKFSPFVLDQVLAIQKESDCVFEFFGIQGKGIKGYLSNLGKLKKKIKEFKPDLIHAHYGLSGLLANLQRRVPVVTTYHGSDINSPNVLKFSKLAMLLSKWNIFVSKRNINIAGVKQKYSLIPCGVDLDMFVEIDKEVARRLLGLDKDKKYVLFAGAFANKVKNYPLAKEAVDKLSGTVEFLELRGYTREQVCWLMNAVDVALMTSFTEGSPQFIKEAMACGCPIVSVDVGDVAEVIDGVDGCYIVERDSSKIALLLQKAIDCNVRTKGRDSVKQLGFDNRLVANKILNVYNNIKP